MPQLRPGLPGSRRHSGNADRGGQNPGRTGLTRRIVLTVKVVTRGRQTGFSGLMSDGTVRITLNAPPVDGKANSELLKWIAGQFGTRPGNVSIIAGAQSRMKTVLIEEPGPGRPPWYNEP